MNGYRVSPADPNLYCGRCITGLLDEKQRLVAHEFKVVRREALLGRHCRGCGEPLLREAPDAERASWRKKYDEDVAAGRRLPNEELPL